MDLLQESPGTELTSHLSADLALQVVQGLTAEPITRQLTKDEQKRQESEHADLESSIFDTFSHSLDQSPESDTSTIREDFESFNNTIVFQSEEGDEKLLPDVNETEVPDYFYSAGPCNQEALYQRDEAKDLENIIVAYGPHFRKPDDVKKYQMEDDKPDSKVFTCHLNQPAYLEESTKPFTNPILLQSVQDKNEIANESQFESRRRKMGSTHSSHKGTQSEEEGREREAQGETKNTEVIADKGEYMEAVERSCTEFEMLMEYMDGVGNDRNDGKEKNEETALTDHSSSFSISNQVGRNIDSDNVDSLRYSVKNEFSPSHQNPYHLQHEDTLWEETLDESKENNDFPPNPPSEQSYLGEEGTAEIEFHTPVTKKKIGSARSSTPLGKREEEKTEKTQKEKNIEDQELIEMVAEVMIAEKTECVKLEKHVHKMTECQDRGDSETILKEEEVALVGEQKCGIEKTELEEPTEKCRGAEVVEVQTVAECESTQTPNDPGFESKAIGKRRKMGSTRRIQEALNTEEEKMEAGEDVMMDEIIGQMIGDPEAVEGSFPEIEMLMESKDEAGNDKNEGEEINNVTALTDHSSSFNTSIQEGGNIDADEISSESPSMMKDNPELLNPDKHVEVKEDHSKAVPENIALDKEVSIVADINSALEESGVVEPAENPREAEEVEIEIAAECKKTQSPYDPAALTAQNQQSEDKVCLDHDTSTTQLTNIVDMEHLLTSSNVLRSTTESHLSPSSPSHSDVGESKAIGRRKKMGSTRRKREALNTEEEKWEAGENVMKDEIIGQMIGDPEAVERSFIEFEKLMESKDEAGNDNNEGEEINNVTSLTDHSSSFNTSIQEGGNIDADEISSESPSMMTDNPELLNPDKHVEVKEDHSKAVPENIALDKEVSIVADINSALEESGVVEPAENPREAEEVEIEIAAECKKTQSPYEPAALTAQNQQSEDKVCLDHDTSTTQLTNIVDMEQLLTSSNVLRSTTESHLSPSSPSHSDVGESKPIGRRKKMGSTRCKREALNTEEEKWEAGENVMKDEIIGQMIGDPEAMEGSFPEIEMLMESKDEAGNDNNEGEEINNVTALTDHSPSFSNSNQGGNIDADEISSESPLIMNELNQSFHNPDPNFPTFQSYQTDDTLISSPDFSSGQCEDTLMEEKLAESKENNNFPPDPPPEQTYLGEEATASKGSHTPVKKRKMGSTRSRTPHGRQGGQSAKENQEDENLEDQEFIGVVGEVMIAETTEPVKLEEHVEQIAEDQARGDSHNILKEEEVVIVAEQKCGLEKPELVETAEILRRAELAEVQIVAECESTQITNVTRCESKAIGKRRKMGSTRRIREGHNTEEEKMEAGEDLMMDKIIGQMIGDPEAVERSFIEFEKLMESKDEAGNNKNEGEEINNVTALTDHSSSFSASIQEGGNIDADEISSESPSMMKDNPELLNPDKHVEVKEDHSKAVPEKVAMDKEVSIVADINSALEESGVVEPVENSREEDEVEIEIAAECENTQSPYDSAALTARNQQSEDKVCLDHDTSTTQLTNTVDMEQLLTSSNVLRITTKSHLSPSSPSPSDVGESKAIGRRKKMGSTRRKREALNTEEEKWEAGENVMKDEIIGQMIGDPEGMEGSFPEIEMLMESKDEAGNDKNEGEEINNVTALTDHSPSFSNSNQGGNIDADEISSESPLIMNELNQSFHNPDPNFPTFQSYQTDDTLISSPDFSCGQCEDTLMEENFAESKENNDFPPDPPPEQTYLREEATASKGSHTPVKKRKMGSTRSRTPHGRQGGQSAKENQEDENLEDQEFIGVVGEVMIAETTEPVKLEEHVEQIAEDQARGDSHNILKEEEVVIVAEQKCGLEKPELVETAEILRRAELAEVQIVAECESTQITNVTRCESKAIGKRRKMGSTRRIREGHNTEEEKMEAGEDLMMDKIIGQMIGDPEAVERSFIEFEKLMESKDEAGNDKNEGEEMNDVTALTDHSSSFSASIQEGGNIDADEISSESPSMMKDLNENLHRPYTDVPTLQSYQTDDTLNSNPTISGLKHEHTLKEEALDESVENMKFPPDPPSEQSYFNEEGTAEIDSHTPVTKEMMGSTHTRTPNGSEGEERREGGKEEKMEAGEDLMMDKIIGQMIGDPEAVERSFIEFEKLMESKDEAGNDKNEGEEMNDVTALTDHSSSFSASIQEGGNIDADEISSESPSMMKDNPELLNPDKHVEVKEDHSKAVPEKVAMDKEVSIVADINSALEESGVVEPAENPREADEVEIEIAAECENTQSPYDSAALTARNQQSEDEVCLDHDTSTTQLTNIVDMEQLLTPSNVLRITTESHLSPSSPSHSDVGESKPIGRRKKMGSTRRKREALNTEEEKWEAGENVMKDEIIGQMIGDPEGMEGSFPEIEMLMESKDEAGNDNNEGEEINNVTALTDHSSSFSNSNQEGGNIDADEISSESPLIMNELNQSFHNPDPNFPTFQSYQTDDTLISSPDFSSGQCEDTLMEENFAESKENNDFPPDPPPEQTYLGEEATASKGSHTPVKKRKMGSTRSRTPHGRQGGQSAKENQEDENLEDQEFIGVVGEIMIAETTEPVKLEEHVEKIAEDQARGDSHNILKEEEVVIVAEQKCGLEKPELVETAEILRRAELAEVQIVAECESPQITNVTRCESKSIGKRRKMGSTRRIREGHNTEEEKMEAGEDLMMDKIIGQMIGDPEAVERSFIEFEKLMESKDEAGNDKNEGEEINDVTALTDHSSSFSTSIQEGGNIDADEISRESPSMMKDNPDLLNPDKHVEVAEDNSKAVPEKVAMDKEVSIVADINSALEESGVVEPAENPREADEVEIEIAAECKKTQSPYDSAALTARNQQSEDEVCLDHDTSTTQLTNIVDMEHLLTSSNVLKITTESHLSPSSPSHSDVGESKAIGRRKKMGSTRRKREALNTEEEKWEAGENVMKDEIIGQMIGDPEAMEGTFPEIEMLMESKDEAGNDNNEGEEINNVTALTDHSPSFSNSNQGGNIDADEISSESPLIMNELNQSFHNPDPNFPTFQSYQTDDTLISSPDFSSGQCEDTLMEENFAESKENNDFPPDPPPEQTYLGEEATASKGSHTPVKKRKMGSTRSRTPHGRQGEQSAKENQEDENLEDQEFIGVVGEVMIAETTEPVKLEEHVEQIAEDQARGDSHNILKEEEIVIVAEQKCGLEKPELVETAEILRRAELAEVQIVAECESTQITNVTRCESKSIGKRRKMGSTRRIREGHNTEVEKMEAGEDLMMDKIIGQMIGESDAVERSFIEFEKLMESKDEAGNDKNEGEEINDVTALTDHCSSLSSSNQEGRNIDAHDIGNESPPIINELNQTLDNTNPHVTTLQSYHTDETLISCPDISGGQREYTLMEGKLDESKENISFPPDPPSEQSFLGEQGTVGKRPHSPVKRRTMGSSRIRTAHGRQGGQGTEKIREENDIEDQEFTGVMGGFMIAEKPVPVMLEEPVEKMTEDQASFDSEAIVKEEAVAKAADQECGIENPELVEPAENIEGVEVQKVVCESTQILYDPAVLMAESQQSGYMVCLDPDSSTIQLSHAVDIEHHLSTSCINPRDPSKSSLSLSSHSPKDVGESKTIRRRKMGSTRRIREGLNTVEEKREAGDNEIMGQMIGDPEVMEGGIEMLMESKDEAGNDKNEGEINESYLNDDTLNSNPDISSLCHGDRFMEDKLDKSMENERFPPDHSSVQSVLVEEVTLCKETHTPVKKIEMGSTHSRTSQDRQVEERAEKSPGKENIEDQEVIGEVMIAEKNAPVKLEELVDNVIKDAAKRDLETKEEDLVEGTFPDSQPCMIVGEPKGVEKRRKMGSTRRTREGFHTEEEQRKPEEKIMEEEFRGETIKDSEVSVVLDQLQEEHRPEDQQERPNTGTEDVASSTGMSAEGSEQVTPALQPGPANIIDQKKGGHANKSPVARMPKQPPGTLGSSGSRSNPYNVVIVGNSSVGKTSFIKYFQSGKFSIDHSATIGIDTCIQSLTVDGSHVTLQLWDTAGQERYHSITRQVFHKAQGLLLMYDITSSQSFFDVRYWANCIQEGAPDDVVLILLGNKADCAEPERQVQTHEGKNLAKEYNMLFMECSAATGDNVILSMENLARMLRQQGEKTRQEEKSLILQKEPPKKKSGCC
ncbi:uncharacterized protein rab44 isoform X1 [Esox lucius]|nr:uncharacterized protein rab44 isoform X1 [Esox lucius]